MKKVLITGVAGMIGSHLLDELLSLDYQVIGLDNLSFGSIENIRHNLSHPNFEFVQLDISDRTALESLSPEPDMIIHLAAHKKIAEKDLAMPTFVSNCKGTDNIFEIALRLNCKVIFASTSDVYGMSTDLPLKEDGDLLLGPNMIRRWSYAVSKLYGEQLAYAHYHDHKLPVVILRYFGGFSPRSNFTWSGGHVPIFIKAVLDNEEMIIHGDGKQTRSMAFVSDLVAGTILAMENDLAIGETINIGNDEELSVIDTAYLIHKLANTGKEIKLKFIPTSVVFGEYKDIMRRIPDLSKAKKILGYEPNVKLHEAIRRTIQELSENKT